MIIATGFRAKQILGLESDLAHAQARVKELSGANAQQRERLREVRTQRFNLVTAGTKLADANVQLADQLDKAQQTVNKRGDQLSVTVETITDLAQKNLELQDDLKQAEAAVEDLKQVVDHLRKGGQGLLDDIFKDMTAAAAEVELTISGLHTLDMYLVNRRLGKKLRQQISDGIDIAQQRLSTLHDITAGIAAGVDPAAAKAREAAQEAEQAQDEQRIKDTGRRFLNALGALSDSGWLAQFTQVALEETMDDPGFAVDLHDPQADCEGDGQGILRRE